MQPSAQNILLRLYKKKQLAPFYIIRGPLSSHYYPLLEWAYQFAAELLSEYKLTPQVQSQKQIKLGHQDLLFITKENDEKRADEDQKSYKIDDPHMREYFKSVQYPPVQIPQKLIFIDKGQLIGEYFANKWLKTLEEPAKNVTTIFLVETQSPLLDTIESRAITLRVQASDPQVFYKSPKQGEDFPNFLLRCAEQWDLPKGIKNKIELFCQHSNQHHYLLDSLRESSSLKVKLYRAMNDYMLDPFRPLRAQQQWLEEIQWFQKAQVFNNSPSERFFGLLKCTMEAGKA